MQIKMPDDIVYELDLNFNSDQRLELVNEIAEKYNDYFNLYWEGKKSTNGNYTHKVKTTLDILGEYLYYGEADNDILTDRQMKRRCGELETPIDFSDEFLVQEFVINYKETTKRKKIQSKYHLSKTHKLTTLRIPLEKRINRTIEDESKTYKHIFSLINGKMIENNNKNENDCRDYIYINGQFEYKCEKDKLIKIDVFTDSDRKLPFVPQNINGEWVTVWNDNTFCFDNQCFLVKGIYEHDKILCFKLDNKKNLFFTPDIKQVKDFSKHTYK